ncbi:hypothetical protein M569_09900, partial [Genlisea aurea]
MSNFRRLLSAAGVVLLAIFSYYAIDELRGKFRMSRRSCQLLKLRGELADLVVTNGTIYTGDPALPFVDSIAVSNGRVLRTGKFSHVKDLVGIGTWTLNLHKKLVVPGFIDSHVHFIAGGLQISRIKLYGISQKSEFVNRVKEAVSGMKPGSWLLGGGWNNDLWGGDLPMASWIDEITPHNPVWLVRTDGHMGLANALSLSIAGISIDSIDPDGGHIVKGKNGEPTGLLIEDAMKLVFSFVPEDSLEDRREALRLASDYALKRGVTTVVDVGRYYPGVSPELPWEDFSDVYEWADSSGNMKIRVCLFFPMVTWQRLNELVKRAGRKLSRWIYLGGVKAFVDGSVGSKSALFFEVHSN